MRCKLVAAVAAFALTSACAPPPTKSLSHDFAVTFVGPAVGEFAPPSTIVEGTITNTGVTPADYTVTLVGSSGDTVTTAVLDVLVGQTAGWLVSLAGYDATITQTGVTSSAKAAGPVSAVTTITSQTFGDFPPHTVVHGTVTNTGSSAAGFTIELQADNGAVTTASASEVQAGRTSEWVTIFFGHGIARILRTTTLHPPP